MFDSKLLIINMILSGNRINTVKFKKIANGKIVRNVEEQYLRNDLPCGLLNCPECDTTPSKIIN